MLARKWRPANFQELVGQEHVQRALINALDDDRLHHAYLFTGTRGVGKTTIARIFAKSLNCETGVTSTPCGVCSACREIAEGRYVDLIEVDAASRTGVDDTRELLENVQYAPSRGRYKVYLIDEVHMFSKSSFNALLKTLEEPPPHVKFLLATTDPEKLPVTILSRCLQFNLKRLPVSLIVNHLQHILHEENIEFNISALPLIAAGADGSMRDALSLLDQALAFGGGSIREDEVRDMLGTVSRERVLVILQALFNRDASAVMRAVTVLAEFSPDYENVLAEILSVLHHMNLAKVVPDALDEFISCKTALLEMCEQVEAEDLQLFYQIALIGRRDLPLAPDARAGFEMVLLRMLAFRPQASQKLTSVASDNLLSANNRSSSGSPVSPPDTRQASSANTGTTTGRGAENVIAGKQQAAVARAAINPTSAPATMPPGQPLTSQSVAAESSSQQTTAVASTLHQVREATPYEPQLPAAENVPASNNEVALSVDKPQASSELDWCHIVQELSLGGLVKQLAINCAFKQRQANRLVVQLDQEHRHLLNPKTRQRLQQALGEYFDIDAELEINIINRNNKPARDIIETPAQVTERKQQQCQQQAEQAVGRDSFVQLLKETFDAEIIPGSIKPTMK